MAVVVGLFDSEADATKAMDRLLREDIQGLDTHVIDGGARGDASTGTPNVTVPLIPNTSGGVAQGGVVPGSGGAAAGGALFGNWLDDMDDVERHFYQDAVKDGSTLALAKVPDESKGQVRLIFQTFGARVYEKK
jgi:hypothetical protein